MKSLFLTCALALPLVCDHMPQSHHAMTQYFNELDDENLKRIEEVRQMQRFIQSRYPGAEIWIGPPPDKTWEETPFLWREKRVWIKRAPIYDRRIQQDA